MYRPKGWATRSVKSYTHKNMKDCTGREIFEAGADAMLEALFKLAEESPTRTFAIDSRIINIYEEVSHA